LYASGLTPALLAGDGQHYIFVPLYFVFNLSPDSVVFFSRNRYIILMNLKQILILSVCCFLPAAVCLAGELQKFTNVRLVDGAYHDGDSFRVKFDDREITIRLYFVDCPETSVSHNTDARRVRSQKRYFALSSARETILYGRKASEFAARQLKKPFTLYTSFAAAMGRSRGGRYYGFVETAGGEDLAHLLVANGYARAYGVSREDPHGVNHNEVSSRLKDLESTAMLGRRGIWKSADAEKLVSLRALERQESIELQLICDELNAPIDNLNINTASLDELETLPGIGPETGRKIIAGRPYRKIDELINLPGISSNRFEKLREYLAEI